MGNSLRSIQFNKDTNYNSTFFLIYDIDVISVISEFKQFTFKCVYCSSAMRWCLAEKPHQMGLKLERVSLFHVSRVNCGEIGFKMIIIMMMAVLKHIKFLKFKQFHIH